MPGKYYWIKERYNPQLKKPYYVACGLITTREAKRAESPPYGCNYMHKFSTKEEYESRIRELKASGANVHGGVE